MKYKVINSFRDKDNNNLLYRVGDEYPVEGYKPSKKRITELTKDHPEHKHAFIEEVKEQKQEDNQQNEESTDEDQSKE